MQSLERLREEWQAVVIERLMHAKRTLGMPLAKRQLTAEQLADLRSGGAELVSERIGVQRSASSEFTTAYADGPGAQARQSTSSLRADGSYGAQADKARAA